MCRVCAADNLANNNFEIVELLQGIASLLSDRKHLEPICNVGRHASLGTSVDITWVSSYTVIEDRMSLS